VSARSDASGCEKTVKAHGASLKRSRVEALNPDRFNASTGLYIGLRFRQANDFTALLPLTAFLQKLDALEAFQHIASGGYGACPF
jgi:hypothetical protein